MGNVEAQRIDAEFVLAQQGYVKSLARSLVFDETLAEDLAQQVWVAALRHPPSHAGALRGWLATIARNLAHLSRRADARRSARERVAARGEAVGAADELVIREQLRASLVAVVLTLEEPCRETIILRYFDDLPPRVIAAKQGVKLSTVKARLKRGLALLREKLDRDCGGRENWCLAFVNGLAVDPSAPAMAIFSAQSFVNGILLMTAAKKLALATGVLLACLVAWRALTPSAPERVAVEAEAGAQIALVDEPDTVESQSPPSEPPDSERTRVAPPRAAPKRAPPVTGPGALDVSVLTLPGRVPLANVAVTVRPAFSSEPNLSARSARTDADGVARFEALESGAVEFFCDRGAANDMSGFGAVKAGARSQAEILIENPGRILGRVVDSAGAAVEGAEIWLMLRANEMLSSMVASSDFAGAFEINGVRARSVYAVAKKRGYGPSSRQFNLALPGADFELELVLRQPAGSLEGVVRDSAGRPLAQAQVIAGPLGITWYLAPDGVPTMKLEGQATTTDAAGHYEFPSILAGPSEIYVRAADFVDGSAQFDIAVGTVTVRDLSLERGATLSGVVKQSNGSTPNSAKVQVRMVGSKRMHSANTDGTGAYRITGLEPGAARLLATDNKREESLEEELTLTARAETNWSPVLSRGLELVGRVLDEEGKPARQYSVYVRRSAPGEEPFINAQTTNREGKFRLSGCRDVEYSVSVYPKSSLIFPVAEARGVRPGGDELILQLDPKLRPSAFIAGRVVGADGRALAGIRVTPNCSAINYHATQLTLADGSFRAGPLPTGRWSLEIDAKGYAPFGLSEQELAAKQELDLGTIRLEQGDPIEVQLLYPDQPHSTRVYMTVRGLDRPLERWCTVDGDGARTPPLLPGRYRLGVEGAYGACVLDTEVVAGQTTKVELELKRGVEFAIRVAGASIGSASRTTVQVRDGAGEILFERMSRADATEPQSHGLCLVPGHYRIEASDAEGRRASREIDVDASIAQQTITLELR